MYKVIFIMLLSLFPLNSYADFEGITTGCKITPSVSPTHLSIAEISRSNNLTRKVGSARRARGAYIKINGKVLDRNCVPIEGAVVKIWQTDAAGNYQDFYAKPTKWDTIDENYDSNFAYNGIAYTNNMGEFTFLTILPGTYDNRAPHINMYISKEGVADLETTMFFNEHPRNSTDPTLTSLDKDKQSLLTAVGESFDPYNRLDERVYNFLVTLDVIEGHRRF